MENEKVGGGAKKPTNFLPQHSVAVIILISVTYLKLSFQHWPEFKTSIMWVLDSNIFRSLFKNLNIFL